MYSGLCVFVGGKGRGGLAAREMKGQALGPTRNILSLRGREVRGNVKVECGLRAPWITAEYYISWSSPQSLLGICRTRCKPGTEDLEPEWRENCVKATQQRTGTREMTERPRYTFLSTISDRSMDRLPHFEVPLTTDWKVGTQCSATVNVVFSCSSG